MTTYTLAHPLQWRIQQNSDIIADISDYEYFIVEKSYVNGYARFEVRLQQLDHIAHIKHYSSILEAKAWCEGVYTVILNPTSTKAENILKEV